MMVKLMLNMKYVRNLFAKYIFRVNFVTYKDKKKDCHSKFSDNLQNKLAII